MISSISKWAVGLVLNIKSESCFRLSFLMKIFLLFKILNTHPIGILRKIALLVSNNNQCSLQEYLCKHVSMSP